MIHLKWLFIGFLFLASCQKIERPAKPDNLIPEETMVDVIVEIYLFNAAKSNYRAILQKTGLTPEQLIYEKFGIDSLQFVESNNYYGADIATYQNIHKKVQEKLEKAKKEVEREINETKVEDSLKLQKSDDDLRTQKIRDSLNLEPMR